MQIYECDAHNYRPKNCRIPSLELRAEPGRNYNYECRYEDYSYRVVDYYGRYGMADDDSENRLVEFIKIEGTVRPKSLTLQNERGIRPLLHKTPEANGKNIVK